jgi:rhodanese-related sulfurtransferase
VTKTPSIVLLDVRTPEEFNGKADVKYGRLKNAINIPIQQLQSRLAELKQYKNREIIVYCSHSHRSPRASYLLTQNGFKHVTNMQGGMNVWNEQVTDKACSASIYVAQ